MMIDKYQALFGSILGILTPLLGNTEAINNYRSSWLRAGLNIGRFYILWKKKKTHLQSEQLYRYLKFRFYRPNWTEILVYWQSTISYFRIKEFEFWQHKW